MKRERRLGRYELVGTVDINALECNAHVSYWGEPYVAVYVKHPLLTHCRVTILGAAMPGYRHLTVADTFRRANVRHTAITPVLFDYGPDGLAQHVIEPGEVYFREFNSHTTVSIVGPAGTIIFY